MNSSHPTKGFTLLELLIAISIFSVMAAMAYGGMRLVIDGSQQIEKSAETLSSLQRTFLFLRQDLEQAVPRGIRDEYGSHESAFICCEDEKLLHLTRGGTRGIITQGTDLIRVEYRLNEGRLERRVWPILDRVQDSKSSSLQLIEKVQGVDIKVLGYGDSEWMNSMPTGPVENKSAVPRAVEFTITTENYGSVSRLFVIGS